RGAQRGHGSVAVHFAYHHTDDVRALFAARHRPSQPAVPFFGTGFQSRIEHVRFFAEVGAAAPVLDPAAHHRHGVPQSLFIREDAKRFFPATGYRAHSWADPG